MGFVKRILRSSILRQIVCWVGSLYIRFVHATTRWREQGRETPEKLWAEGKPFVIAFWHGRLLMMAPFWNPRAPMNMLISEHRDGRLIADTVKHLSIGTIAGSSSKGGGRALRQMVRALKSGGYVGITPDGPRGPRGRATGGIVALARLADVPVVPATFATKRRHMLSSWDQFHVAFPFGRGVYLWGDPIPVRDMDEDVARKTIEDALNRLTAEADREMGHEPTPPAAIGTGMAT